MRRIVLWLASTITIVVLLFGYHTSTNDISAATAPSSASSPATTSPSASSPSTSPSSSSPSTSPSSSSPSTSSSSSSAAPTTYDGSVASTRWGPVQVQIIVTAGKITEVTVLQQPSGNPKDAEINDYALPVLVQDTLTAQSADIDMVSGATVTSTGYVQSLQAALDEAGL
ncbi:Uncharacterized protein, contains FMN-binding domain [Friedmanniella luteola]|uniref:Uncharacterized protein, contains FMN-binding domain n=1 Tax=Friedmanniella luteola TaxID=546871 RepID=A0A1H1L9V9_9ACTN|nr:Uncharacterized protein, contains FMN-binding domain [Friedmanniella luteola]